MTKKATVLVLGAGMAGLVAGYELLRRDCNPVILEARQRIGGRIHTIRDQAPGMYAEAGAMRIPRIHSRTLRYCEDFGLRLRPCVSGNPDALVHVAGHRMTAADAAVVRWLPAGTSPPARHEQGRSNDELWDEATDEIRARLSETGFAVFDELALKYDGYSIRGFLKAEGWSEAAIERYGVLTATESTLNTGILQELREVVGGAYADTQEIAGGMDQLPSAFYPHLKERIWLGTAVTAITQDASSVTVQAGRRSFRGDYAICTIPFPVLRGIDIDPPFSFAKQKAIRQLHYDAATKIFFQVRRPFWEETDHIHGGTTVTDLPIRRIIYPSGPVAPGQRAMLLASYTWGQDALRWAALAPDQRIELALRDVARIHPEVLAEFESGISYSWSQDPYAMGGYALFEPDQQTSLSDGIRRSEGRVHFAGEHCSSWPAWLEGAVESGQHAAERVALIAATQRRWLTLALNERGAECVHVRSRPRLVAYLEATFQPGDYVLDLGHDFDLAAVARRILECGAEWIVAGNESGVRMADELTHLTRLPGNLHKIAGARRDKHLMSERLRAVGLAAPRGTLVSATKDAVAWFEAAGLESVVVKPVNSAGSDHVRFCRTSTDVLNACDGILASENVFGIRNRAAVIQEALTGPEYYVNTVSVGGQHLIAETWRYTKTRTPDGAPVFDYEEPTDPGSSPVDSVHAYVRNALDALGVRYGAAHSEVILTARGPVLIDPGIRLGGGVLPWVAEKFLGYSHASLLAESIVRPSDALARGRRLPESWPAPIRYVSLINLQPGLARPTQQWTQLLSSLPTVVAVAAVAAEGTFLPRTSDLISSPGYVYLSAIDAAGIEAGYHRIRAWEQTSPYTRGPSC